MIEAAFTGTSAYIYLTMKDPSDWMADNISGGYYRVQHMNDHNPLWYLLGYETGDFPHAWDGLPWRRELQVSGFWTWRAEYHAQFLGAFFHPPLRFFIVELLRRSGRIYPGFARS